MIYYFLSVRHCITNCGFTVKLLKKRNYYFSINWNFSIYWLMITKNRHSTEIFICQKGFVLHYSTFLLKIIKNTGSPPLTRFSNNTFLNNTVYFGTLICPFSTKSLLRLHSFLLTRLFFQSLKKPRKQRTACMYLENKTGKETT